MVDVEEAKDALEQDLVLQQQVAFFAKSLAAAVLLLAVSSEMVEEEIHGSQGHGFVIKCNLAQTADVLVLDIIFVIRTTADSVKLYIAKTASMTTVERERRLFAT